MAVLRIDKLLIDSFQDVLVELGKVVGKKVRDAAFPYRCQDFFGLGPAYPLEKIILNHIFNALGAKIAARENVGGFLAETSRRRASGERGPDKQLGDAYKIGMLEKEVKEFCGRRACQLTICHGQITLPRVDGEPGFRLLPDGFPCVMKSAHGVGKSCAHGPEIHTELTRAVLEAAQPEKQAGEPNPEVRECLFPDFQGAQRLAQLDVGGRNGPAAIRDAGMETFQTRPSLAMHTRGRRRCFSSFQRPAQYSRSCRQASASLDRREFSNSMMALPW